MEEQIERIVKWLRERTEEAGAKGLLVGVSGGLDSAVVANLIKRAYPDDSLGVILPIQTSEANIQDAKDVTDACDIEAIKVDLTETHRIMYKEISDKLVENKSHSQAQDQLADANLRARLRMSALYTISAHRGYLVVGTDNASEYFTGYFTKYGDGGVDILPIVDFTKSEVREMAKALDVPASVIEKVPSADLWEDQTDEMEMGITYAAIDAYLKGETISESDRVIIESMHEKSKHKRDSLPMYKRK
jgi:NAD+ synthase